MSDDKKAPDGSEISPRTYSEEEFKEVIAQRQEGKRKIEDLEKKLGLIEDAKKLEEEKKAIESGEAVKLLETQKKVHEELKLQFETEKIEADAYRNYRKIVIEDIKKQMGDKWLPEFESFSIESLSKLPNISIIKVGVSGSPPTLSAKEDVYTREEVARMSQSEVNQNLEKVNKSIAFWK